MAAEVTILLCSLLLRRNVLHIIQLPMSLMGILAISGRSDNAAVHSVQTKEKEP